MFQAFERLIGTENKKKISIQLKNYFCFRFLWISWRPGTLYWEQLFFWLSKNLYKQCDSWTTFYDVMMTSRLHRFGCLPYCTRAIITRGLYTFYPLYVLWPLALCMVSIQERFLINFLSCQNFPFSNVKNFVLRLSFLILDRNTKWCWPRLIDMDLKMNYYLWRKNV